MDFVPASEMGKGKYDYPDAESSAPAPVMTEEAYAGLLRDEGARVLFHRGRYWRQLYRGCFEGVHPLARMSAGEARRPTLTCWGFRAALEEGAVDRANSALPVLMLATPQQWDPTQLDPRTRQELRRCQRTNRIVRLTDSALLRDQGFTVVKSLETRVGLPSGTAEEYFQCDCRRADEECWIVLAGLSEYNTLSGYLTAHVVDGTAYADRLAIGTESLPTCISTGLYCALFELLSRTKGVREINNGFHWPAKEGLTDYKTRLGFALTMVPSRCFLMPGVRTFLRRRYPYTLYRFTGDARLADIQ